MSITEIGRDGEAKARNLLKAKGFQIFQADWIGYKNGKYTMFEIKQKERYQPPPFEGHGLDIRQVKARLQFQEKTGIRCCLVVFEIGTDKIFYQWLDALNDSEYFDTRNRVRVYPLTSFLENND